MNKAQMKAAILAAKDEAGKSWEQIAVAIGMSPVWTTSACLGMNSMPRDKAAALCEALGLDTDVAKALETCPHKHWCEAAPTDPLVYRFYEMIHVYGDTIKALIHEKFGDGINERHRFHDGHRQGRASQRRPRGNHTQREIPALQGLVAGACEDMRF